MPRCDECKAPFDPDANLAAGEPPEFWCSTKCQRAWQLRQVDDARGVELAGVAERIAERTPFATALLRRQFALD